MTYINTNKLASFCKIATLSLTISACSISYNAVGEFENYAAVYEGNVTVGMGGVGTISLNEIGGAITCSGTTVVTYQPNPYIKRGARGEAFLECSDGRIIEASWHQNIEDGGSGKGQDQNGNKVRFRYDTDQAVLSIYKKSLLAVSLRKEKIPPLYKPKETRKEKGYSTGTGFFISSDGHFITNYHVVEDADDIKLILEDGGKEYSAVLVASDPANDIVIGKIEAHTPWIELAMSAQLSKGDDVLTLGYPLISIQGQQQKATFGRVNSLAGIKDDVRFYQVDVPIQPGNSGGPLMNTKGEVVGVITATLDQIAALRTSGSLPQNVNYAVKTDYLMPLIKSKFPELLPKFVKRSEKLKMSDIVRQSQSAVFLIVSK